MHGLHVDWSSSASGELFERNHSPKYIRRLGFAVLVRDVVFVAVLAGISGLIAAD